MRCFGAKKIAGVLRAGVRVGSATGILLLLLCLLSETAFGQQQTNPAVTEVRTRLSRTPEGRILLRCLEAHGLEDYFRIETISVRVKAGMGRPAFSQLVATRQVRGRISVRTDAALYENFYYSAPRYFPLLHQELSGKNASVAVDLGFDGEQYWAIQNGVRSEAPGALRLARRQVLVWHFWNNVPFKFGDPLANLEYKGEAEMGGATYQKLRVHWGNGIGETPDDWFVLYINKENGVLEKIHFTVSGRPDKPILMSDWSDPVRVEGVLFPTQRAMHRSDETAMYGELVELQQLEDIQFSTTLDISSFKPSSPGME